MNNKRLYSIWQNMKQRCHNSNNPKWEYYGGKGIKVCSEWYTDFKAFEKWALNNGYADNLEIDRIDNNGNYESSNCQWLTHSQNCHKTSIYADKRIICIETGKTYPTATEAARDIGLKSSSGIYWALRARTLFNKTSKAGGYTWMYV